MSLQEQIERFKKEHRWDPEYLAEGYHLDVLRQILEEIDRRGWDQSQLAGRKDNSEDELTRLFTEREDMTLNVLAKLAAALEMDWRLNLVPAESDDRPYAGQTAVRTWSEDNYDTVSEPKPFFVDFNHENSMVSSGT